ncbi:MAG: outer membrane protein assembly factor BamA [Planctomycetota bacterium]
MFGPANRSRRKNLRAATAAAVAAALAGTAATSLAQPQPDIAPPPTPTGSEPSPYDNRPIRAVILRTPLVNRQPGDPEFVPLTGFEAQRAENNIRTAPGTPFLADTVRNDVTRLNRLNAYSRVETLVQPLDDGSVNVIYTLVPRAIIAAAEVVGNTELTDQQIRPIIGRLEGAPVDRFAIDRAARRIEEVYRERGFFNATVEIDIDELEETGLLIFRVREGVRIQINEIRFEATDGALAFSRRLLRRQTDTRISGLFGRGAIDEAILERDVASLVGYYRDAGYLDARADYELLPSPDGREAIITFLIEQGRVYTLRRVLVDYADPEEDNVFSPEQIAGLLTIRPGEVYSERELRRSVQAVSNAYGQLGYTSVSASRADLRDPDLPEVDLLLRVNPRQKYKTGEIIIQGNEITQQKVIRREIELLPDRPLDTTAQRRTENRIRRLRLFSPGSVKLTLQPPDPAEPDYRDVLIEVEETNTGSFDFGGAVSTDTGFFGRIALTQRNFDIADTPDSVGELFAGRAFRGAGQTFTVEALPGDLIERYQISLAEPNLFGTNYNASASAFFRDRDFEEFDETRFGGRFGIGRSFGTRWSGAINLRLESVDLANVGSDQAVDFFEFDERQTFLAVGPRLIRSTLDNNFLPTRGTRTELTATQYIGDFDFTRLEAEHSVFIPIFEDFLERRTVIELTSRMGYIPQGQEDTPVFERFYMGGNNFRGFRFRTISPRNFNSAGVLSEDPVGGTWLFFLGAQVRQPLYEELLSVVAFVDSGTVREDVGLDEYRVSVGFGFRVFVSALSPAPLAFDFGFPLVEEENDESQLFSFSVDIPF